MVDLRFADWTGTWKHISTPVHQLTESRLRDGVRIDLQSLDRPGEIEFGPSKGIAKFMADCTSARIDPFMLEPTLVLQGNLRDQDTGEAYPDCARSLAKRAEAYLLDGGWGDLCSIGLEANFYIFDDVRFANRANTASYRIDSALGHWNSDREEFPNLAYKQCAYDRLGTNDLSLPPMDVHHDLRTTMVNVLEDLDIAVSQHRSGTAGAGQSSIGLMRKSLLEQADALFWLKYVVKNVARRAGHAATFMPYPLSGQSGSRLRLMWSLWHSNRALFFGDGPLSLSDCALHFAAGVFEHASALSAFTKSSTNSYREVFPHIRDHNVRHDYGHNHGHDRKNTEVQNSNTVVGVPSKIAHPDEAFLESPCGDAAGNSYLTFSAWLMAGVDGIKRQLGAQATKNMDQSMTAESVLGKSIEVPRDFASALKALESDHEFLVQGGVFHPETLHAWIARRRERELGFIAQRPHPGEFELYFQI